MAESKITGDGLKTINISKDGAVEISSDEPLTINSSLPVTDIRVNALELVDAKVTYDGNKRTFQGRYADGGIVEISVDVELGTFQTNGNDVLSTITDGDDKSHTVLTYQPKRRSISKKLTRRTAQRQDSNLRPLAH